MTNEYESTDSGVRLYRCEDWDDFIRKIRPKQAGKYGGDYIYRGHGNPDWLLSSQWERRLTTYSIVAKERGQSGYKRLFGRDDDEDREKRIDSIRDAPLKYFKLLARQLPDSDLSMIEKENEWWAIGRHHGLQTPLLDWSHSPYIAAFFGFTQSLEIENPHLLAGSQGIGPGAQISIKPVNVWALATSAQVLNGAELKLVTEVRHNYRRQIAQQGLFTRLSHDVHIDIESYLSDVGQAHRLERYEIPGSATGKAIEDLRLMNITYSQLFPDLDGIAWEANASMIIGNLGY